MPSFDERHRWPAGGRLLFYADIELDEIEGLYLEHAENAAGERARVLYTPPGVDVISVRPVRPHAALAHRTIPADVDTAATPRSRRAGRESRTRRRRPPPVRPRPRRLAEADPNNDWAGDHWPPQHWIGGHRGDYEPETTVLLNLNADPALNFQFMDGGAIRFEIPTHDLTRCDFTRATAIGDPE